MLKQKTTTMLLISSLALAPLAGCETIQDNPRTSGAAIGGVAGAAAGALIGGKDNRLLGALIGGALGAGGGYLIGSSLDKADDKDAATRANDRAQKNPVTADEARRARTADVNKDGYVSLDEVVAMDKAGLSNTEMIDRLKATGQFFELTSDQEKYLEDHGVDRDVVVAMRDINRDVKDQAYDRYKDRVTRNDRHSDRGSESISTER
jgi:hypothetical protein